MRQLLPFVLVFTLVACSIAGAGGPHEEQPDSRIDYDPISTFKNNVLTLNAMERDSTGIRLDTLRDAESTALYPRAITGYSGRSSTFLKTGANSRSVGYAVVSWNDDDPTDYLSAGWSIHFANQCYPDIDVCDPDSSV